MGIGQPVQVRLSGCIHLMGQVLLCCVQDAAPSKVKWYDIDLDTAPDAIPSLRRRIPGVKVICYISAGTWEPFRAVPILDAFLRRRANSDLFGHQ